MSNSPNSNNRIEKGFPSQILSVDPLWTKPSLLDLVNETSSQRESGETTETEDNGDTDVGIVFTPEHTATPVGGSPRPYLPPTLTDTLTFKARKRRAPYDQLQTFQNNDVHSNARLHRIYSETETSNFNSFNGRRMFDDDRYRPHKAKHLDPPSPLTNKYFSTTRLHNPSRSLSQHGAGLKRTFNESGIVGLEDEYIPDLDFSTTVQQWASDSQSDISKGYNSSLESSFYGSGLSSAENSIPSTPIGHLHAQVEPVSVPIPRRAKHYKTDLTNDEEKLVAKLPENFVDLPFSVRRKLLAELAPDGNRDALSKIVKKKFQKKNTNSPALHFLNSFSEKSTKMTDEGSVILNHRLGKIIGFGAWGIIREAKSTGSTEVNAIKVIHTKTDASKRFFKREASIWHKLHHSNILPLLNIKEEPKTIFCLTVKANGGTLFDLVSKWGLYDSETSPHNRLAMIRNYALQIISALIYMHNRGYVHGDVKLENVLLNNSVNDTKCYVCDFGMSLKFKEIPVGNNEDVHLANNISVKRRPSIPRSSSGNKIFPLKSSSLQRIVLDRRNSHDDTRLSLHHLPTSSTSSSLNEERVFGGNFEFEYPDKDNDNGTDDPNIPHTHIGSLPYASPELLESSPPPLGPSADIWAFGVLMYTMIVGKLPFQHQYEPRLRAMISAGKYDLESLEAAVKHDPNWKNAVEGCLMTDLNKRLNLEEVEKFLVDARV